MFKITMFVRKSPYLSTEEFIKLWEQDYYPRETYLKECNGIEIKAFVHYLAWRDYFQDSNLINKVELFKGVWQ